MGFEGNANALRISQKPGLDVVGTPKILLREASYFLSLSHRARAAFLAIWDRFRALRDFALALPPLRPPRRPRATAGGFCWGSGGASWAGASPATWATMLNATELGSRGLLERLGMPPTRPEKPVSGQELTRSN